MNKPSFLKPAIMAFAVAALFATASPSFARVEDQDWTGAHIGANVGGGAAKGQVSDLDCWLCTSAPFNRPLVQAGVNGGYDWQFGAGVVGLEAEANLGNQNYKNLLGQDFNLPYPVLVQSKVSWSGAALARVGLAVQNVMTYLIAGPAIARVQGGATNTAVGANHFHAVVNSWQPGFKAGVGFEFMVSPHVSVRAQYSMLTIQERVEYGVNSGFGRTGRFVWANSQSVATIGTSWRF